MRLDTRVCVFVLCFLPLAALCNLSVQFTVCDSGREIEKLSRPIQAASNNGNQFNQEWDNRLAAELDRTAEPLFVPPLVRIEYFFFFATDKRHILAMRLEERYQ